MVAAEHAAATLKPWLGTQFVTGQPDTVRSAAMRLNAYRPNRDQIARVAQELDSLLFLAVRDATAGKMALRLDTGDTIRIRLSDFALMADELLYLLFEDMAAQPGSFEAIYDYSMHSNSLCSLKALYLLYPGRQTTAELDTVKRIIKTCHPAFRWRQWLDP